ncbi:hypothetical protein GCM10009731_48070 [Streptomyces globosus]
MGVNVGACTDNQTARHLRGRAGAVAGRGQCGSRGAGVAIAHAGGGGARGTTGCGPPPGAVPVVRPAPERCPYGAQPPPRALWPPVSGSLNFGRQLSS